MQSLWRDARVEPLDSLTEYREKHPGDDFRGVKPDCRAPVCRGRTDLARGSKGASSPLASLAEAEKPMGFWLKRCIVACHNAKLA